MNKNCEIARDLMPLVIDSAASQNSQNYVNEHIEECPDCKNFFDGMKAALPLIQSEQEKKEFNMVAQSLKRKRLFRICLFFFLGVFLAIGFYLSWQFLCVQLTAELPHDQYEISLSQLENGNVIVISDFSNTKRRVGPGEIGKMDDEGNYCVYFDPSTTVLPVLVNENITITMPTYSVINIESVDRLYKGYKNAELIWQEGDPIPKASKEMEEYFSVQQERLLYGLELDTAAQTQYILSGETLYSPPDLDDPKFNELLSKETELYSLVPEWNK